MRHTTLTRTLWTFSGVMWVATLIAAWCYADALSGGAHHDHIMPTAAVFLGSPTVVAVNATLSLSLMAWQLWTPVATVASVMFAAGQRAGCRHDHGAPDGDDAVVIPMPRARI